MSTKTILDYSVDEPSGMTANLTKCGNVLRSRLRVCRNSDLLDVKHRHWVTAAYSQLTA